MSTVVPYRLARLASLFLSFSFGVVGFAIGLNALIQSNDAKDHLRASVPRGTTVSIDTNDVFRSGVVVTVASGLIALTSAFAVSSAIVGSWASATVLSVQSAVLGFFTLFLFAALTAFTDFVANREASVSAFIGTLRVPDMTVRQIEAALGATPVYKDIDYLKHTAILPWFAFLFGLTSAVLTFIAARRTAAAATTSGFGRALTNNASVYPETDEKKTGDVEMVHQV